MTRYSNSPRVSKSFAILLLKSFLSSFGPVATIGGLGLSFLAFYAVPDHSTIRVRFIVLPALLSIYAIFLLFHAAWSAYHEVKISIPRVFQSLEPPKVFPSAKALLLVEASEQYAHDSTVSIYYLKDEFERIIGIGRVYNIQDNGFIQILVILDLSSDDEWKGILSNDVTMVKQLRIKPTVPWSLLENDFNG